MHACIHAKLNYLGSTISGHTLVAGN
uniref:Uncharacterized protein n=1 Tax=Arundo donax TaxID=35708 RepID=A0A0A8ZSX0_ARUDO